MEKLWNVSISAEAAVKGMIVTPVSAPPLTTQTGKTLHVFSCSGLDWHQSGQKELRRKGLDPRPPTVLSID